MKLSSGVKRIMVSKLVDSFKEEVTLEDFNRVYLLLEQFNGKHKIAPYGIFTEEKVSLLRKTKSGEVFRKWSNETTSKISSDFNKGRKLQRQFKEIVDTYRDVLPYSLPSLVVFTSSISSFFYCSDTNSGLESNSEESADLMGVLNHLSDFLASVLFIDMIEDTVTTENILEVFIKNHSGAGFCGKVIDSAQTYIEHRV